MSQAPGKCLLLLAAAAALTMSGAGSALAQSQDRQEVAQAAEQVTGKGVIKAVNKDDRQLQIAHEAIPELKWPPMTMAFKVAPGVRIDGLAPGTNVTFTLSKSAQGGYVIEKIERGN